MSPSDNSRASRVVGFVFLTVFLDLVGFGIIIPLFPFYVKSMGGGPETAGIILSCFSATQLVATPFLGRLSDRVGRRPVILISLAGNAASMLLFALATRTAMLPLLFASRIMAGATAGNISACQAAVADVTRADNRAKGMGRLGAGIGLGMVLGPVIGGTLSHFGPSAPPLAAGALALADLVAAFFFMPETRVPIAPDAAESGKPTVSLGQALLQRPILFVFGMYFLTFLYMSNIQASLAFLTNVRLGWGESENAWLFVLLGCVMLLVQGALIGRMTRAWGARNIVVGGSLASAAGLLLLASAHSGATLIAGLALLALGLGVVNPCLSAIAADEAGPARQGAILGFAQSAGGLARTIGPVTANILFARVGTAAPFAGGAAAALMTLVLGLSLIAPRSQRA